MADTALDICSRALVMIGADPITSFQSNTTPSKVAATLYEPTVRAMLTKRWGFARTTQELSLLADAPDGNIWDAAYAMPAEALVVHRVEIAGLPIRYERFENQIRCNAGPADTVVMTFIRRVDETEFPAYFVGALELELAARFAFPVTAQESAQGFWRREANKAWADARAQGSQEQSSQRLPISRMKAVRLGLR